MTDHNNRFSPIAAAGDGLLLLCALCGFTSSFLSLYGREELGRYSSSISTPLDLCAAQGDRLLLLAALLALCALALWSLPRFRGAAVGGLAALWGFSLFARWETVVQGAGLTVHNISDLFAQRVSWGRTFYYSAGLSPVEAGDAARLFLVLALAALALVLGWAIVRARRWWIVALLTLPPLLPGLLADLYPSWPAFMALCTCWCAMLLTDLCKWAAPDRRGVLTLIILPCVAVVLGIVTIAFPREGYTRPDWAKSAESELYTTANRVSEFFAQFDGPFQRTVTYVGAAEEADLARAGPLRYTGRTVLQVTSDYDGRLYLRGSSLAVYEDGVWTALPEGTYEEYCPPDSHAPVPLYFPAMQEQDSPTYTATVSNVGAIGACVYAPYFPLPEDSDDTGALPVEDAYFARRQGQWVHTLSFVERTPPPVRTGPYVGFGPSEGRAAAGQYAGYAYGHYLDVPEEVRVALAEQFSLTSGHSLAYINTQDPVEAATDIAFVLNDLCEYDQSAPAPPDGADPVVYFLTQSHQGYCMHFASAATLMLRTLGIPARYVSGFTVESVPDRQMSVPDRAAHAWVEVWIGGFGWYPVEVTPAAAFEWYEQGTIAPEDLPTVPLEESEAPEPTPAPADETAAPSEAPDASLPGEGGGEDLGGGADLTALFAVLRVAGVTLGVFALLWLIQYLPKRYRARRLASPDRNRAALDGYGYLLRMKRWGGRVNERAVELAQKARFSRDGLTQEELDQLLVLVNWERERLCVVLDPLPRLVFRYFWGMPKWSRPPEEELPPGNPG